MPERFDVIVIGSGSGGRSTAKGLAEGGRRVAMVESHLVGGECPYWACMPAKGLLRPGEAVAEARRVPGVSAAIDDWAAVAAFRDDITSGFDDTGKAERYSGMGVTILRGRGRLAGAGRVAVDATEYATDRVVIATGSEPVIPDIRGLESVECWTNRETMEMRSVPSSAAVLGGGPVGIEIGQMLRRFGCRVTLVESSSRLLAGEEPAVGALIEAALASDGVEVRLDEEVVAVEAGGSGALLALSGGGEVEAERLIVAVGRRPVTDGLGLESVGIDASATGIAVDEHCRAADGVWAIGDVTGVGQFTHLASYQGRVVCADILGHPVAADYRAVPRSVFCDPEVAAVGLTVERARAAGLDTVAATVPLSAVERSRTYGRGFEGEAGVLADARERVVVGAHAVGPMAAEWIHLMVLAIRARVPLDVLRDLIGQFPTFSEAFITAVRRLEI